jgi:hypothetical protein
MNARTYEECGDVFQIDQLLRAKGFIVLEVEGK